MSKSSSVRRLTSLAVFTAFSAINISTVFADNGGSVTVVANNTSGTGTNIANATGGNGTSANGGGTGGNSEAGAQTGTAVTPFTGMANATANSTGGDGFGDFNGGLASLEPPQAYGTTGANVSAVGTGGAGGGFSDVGSGPGAGGNGGAAGGGGQYAFFGSSASGDASVELTLNGGSGGYGNQEPGGNGASSRAFESVSGAAPGGTLTLTQIANGGSAGGTGGGGNDTHGGTATGALSDMVNNFNGPDSPNLVIETAEVSSGNGGVSSMPIGAGNSLVNAAGGSTAEIDLDTVASVNATAFASDSLTHGGNVVGQGVQAGDGNVDFASVTTSSMGTGSAGGSVVASVQCFASQGGQVVPNDGPTENSGNGGKGGNANALGFGDNASANFGVNVVGNAVAGNGGQGQGAGYDGGNGGNAVASASANGRTTNSVSATASAVGGKSGIGAMGATDGLSGAGLADAYGIGLGGNVSAMADSSGPLVTTVIAIANAPIVSGTTSHTEALATYLAEPHSILGPSITQVTASAFADPTGAEIGTALDIATRVAAAFNNDPSGVLGLLTLSTSNMPTGSDTAFHAETDWAISLSDLQNPSEPLVMGLLSAESSGAGTVNFTISSNNGDVQISRSFADFASADAYFTDDVLELGTVEGNLSISQSLDLNISIDVHPSTAGASFDPDIIFGSPAVPEPASLGICGVVGVGMLLRRRRSR